MSKHLATQKLSAYFWAVIVVTSGCGLILLALNPPTLAVKHHQQVKAPTEESVLVQTPTLDRTLHQAQVVETRAAPASERND